MFFFAVGFDAGAGTGRFFQKLLSADALTHRGFSERVLFPLVFTDGAIIDISDVCEKFAPEPLCPVEHNPEVHTVAYLDFDAVLYLDYQESRPAMSLCFSFPFVSGTFLVLSVVFSSFGQRIPLTLFTVEHQREALRLSGGNSVLRLMRHAVESNALLFSLGQSRRLVTGWSSLCV